MSVTLIILTRNEIQGVAKVFPKIPVKKVDEVLVIDGQSKDGTAEFFRQKKMPVIVQEKLGRGEAFRIALKKAKCDNVIFFSPDGNENPSDIPKMADFLDKGFDLVIASRFIKGARADDHLQLVPYRGWGNRFFTGLSNFFFGGNLTDSINGFRGVNKKKISALHLDAQGFAIEYQMSMRALKLGYKIKEFPTFEGDRIGGKSGAKTVDTGLYFVKMLLREIGIGKRF
ncbi:MAG: glycosyltransferase family 2 protein [Candidatus Micrarchaeota archaeon]